MWSTHREKHSHWEAFVRGVAEFRTAVALDPLKTRELIRLRIDAKIEHA